MSVSNSRPSEKGSGKFWLYAFRDHLANLKVYSNCLCTADVQGDGDYKLLIADGSRRLKVYGGTTLQQELKLPGVPAVVTTMYIKAAASSSSSSSSSAASSQLLRPIVAVGVGPFVLMYHNYKPLYRFHLPPVQIDEEELRLWADLVAEKIALAEAIAQLEVRSANGHQLSSRMMELLLMDNNEERASFVRRMKDKPLKELDVVTCMASLQVDQLEDKTPSTVVVGTERGWLHILQSGVVELALSLRLPSAPVYLLTAGCLNVSYRLIVSCRDGRLYIVKNGVLRPNVLQPDAQPVAIARYDSLIAVATVSNTLSYYTLSGRRQFHAKLPVSITNMTTLTDPVTDAARGLVLALSNGELHVYVNTQLIHVSQVYGTVTAMLYSRYGREDAALLLVLQNGSLVVELLHRKADLTPKTIEGAASQQQQQQLTSALGPPPEQDIPIPLPKLSSVFTVQTERERSHGVDMYRLYQYELCHMRLYTAKAYLDMAHGGSAAAQVVQDLQQPRGESSGLRLVASVEGLGPTFRLVVTAHNGNSKGEVLEDVWLTVSYSPQEYTVANGMQRIAYLAPGKDQRCSFLVRLRDGQCEAGTVTVYAVQEGVQSALYAVDVELPAYEPLE